MENNNTRPLSGRGRLRLEYDFFSWLNKNSSFFWTQFIALLSFLGIIFEVTLHFKQIFVGEPDQVANNILTTSYILQTIFILIVVFILNNKSFSGRTRFDRYAVYYKAMMGRDLVPKEREAVMKTTELNLNIFARYWLSFWKWILVLYIVFILGKLLGKKFTDDYVYIIIYNAGETLLNNLSMAYLFICFLVVQSPLSGLYHDTRLLNKQFNTLLTNKSLVFSVVIGTGILHAAILSYLASVGNDAGMLQINKLFSIVSGIFNCCALALLIARLDSKIINVPSGLISILILYAALQPLYVFFGDDRSRTMMAAVSCAALFFKVYFYLIIAYIINTNRLADLFMTFPLIKKMIERDGYGMYAKTENDAASKIDKFLQNVDLMTMILESSGYKTRGFRSKKRKLEQFVSNGGVQ